MSIAAASPLLSLVNGPVALRRWQRVVDHRGRHLARLLVPLRAAGAAPSAHRADVMVSVAHLPGSGAERQALVTALGVAGAGRGCALMVGAMRRRDIPRDLAARLDQAGIAVVAAQDVEPAMVDPPHGQALAFLPEALMADLSRSLAVLRRHRPRVLHSFLDWNNVAHGLAGVLAGVPRIILSLRSVGPRHFHVFDPGYLPVYQALAGLAGVSLTANSQAGAQDYEDWLGLERGSIAVIRNGLDPALSGAPSAGARAGWRGRFAIPPDAPVVGGLFRCAEEKRPLLWLKAAGQLLRRRPNAHFILFGQGFDTSPGEAGAMERLFSGYRLVLGLDDAARQQALALRVQDFVRDHGLGGRVHCPGQVRDAASAMAAMDAMLLTSTMEGTPNAVLEAQLQGIPVVVGAGGGAAEACLPGVTGFALSCPTSRRLAEALDRALAPDFKTRAAAEGPGFVARRYGLGRMAAETLALYG